MGRPRRRRWIALALATGVLASCLGAAAATAAPSFLLTVRLHGEGSGVVTTEPAGIDCGATCSHAFEEGTLVALSATPGPGWVFLGWDGVCSGKGICNLLVDSAHDVGATFGPAPAETLRVRREGNGAGTVTSEPPGIDCGETCTAQFAAETQVALTVAPGPGSVFTGWSGLCFSLASTCNFFMNDGHDVTAHFEPSPTELLTVHTRGSGTVTSEPAGLSCGPSCEQRFPRGATVTLSAVAGAGREFTGWGGSCAGTGACVVTMDSAHEVSAHFEPPPEPPASPPAPRTRLTRATVDSQRRLASFEFRATGLLTGFQCSLRPRGKPPAFRDCWSPQTYRRVGSGRFVFVVRAVGPGGSDPTPARRAIRVR